MGASFRMTMQSGPTPGKEYSLDKAEMFIGRDLGNDLVINDPEISRRHSRLFLQGGAYVIEDLGSTNGTTVNGQRLSGPYVLRSGDNVTLGERIMLYFEVVTGVADATVSAANPPAPAYTPPVAPPPAYSAAPAYPPQPAYPPVQQPVQQYQPTYEPPSPPVQQVPVQPRQPVYQSQPSYPPPVQAYEPVTPQQYVGQVPPSGDEPRGSVQARIPIWIWVLLALMLITILVLVIDDFRLWCPIFGLC